MAANKRFRETITTEAKKRDIQLFIPPMQLCTDNAVMGAIAVERFKAKDFDSLDLDIAAGLVR